MSLRPGRRPGEYRPTLDIASVTARRPGKGAFAAWATKVVEPLAEEFQLPVYVENVLQERFAEFWRGRGYTELPKLAEGAPPCFEKDFGVTQPERDAAAS